MKVVAIGKKEILLGFTLAGIKERLETDDPNETINFLHELEKRETSFLAILTSQLYQAIRKEIDEIQTRKPSFIFYELKGDGLRWRRQ